MTFSLYDAVVPSNLQILGAVDALLDKAAAFCSEQGRAEAELIDARLAPDMLPFGYQVKSCAAHSIGGIEGVRAGTFSPIAAIASGLGPMKVIPLSAQARANAWFSLRKP